MEIENIYENFLPPKKKKKSGTKALIQNPEFRT
jgi:hypothetical protein